MQKFLCKIDLRQDSYEIEMSEENSSLLEEDNLSFTNFDIDNVPWIISKYVFENTREHGYKLHKGDILKLGKYILKIKEIGLDEEDKRVVIERKNTMKFIKNKNMSINNISQIPLNNNQQEDDYTSILNINNNINLNNIENQNDNNNLNLNLNENSPNKNNINESESRSYKGNNIHIIEHENEESKKDESSSSNVSNSEPSKVSNNPNNNENNNNILNKNNSDNSNNNINNNLNFASIVNVNQENFNNNSEKNNNIVSVYYNNTSIQNNNSNININNISGDNKNLYFINIIKNNSASNESKINSSSFKVNSFGINTFNKDSFKNSSINKSNFPSIKLNETSEDNEKEKLEKEKVNKNSKKFLTVDSTSKLPITKNSIKELKSTASFNKKKILDNLQKKILKDAEKSSKPLCRICLSEEHEKENPLIHPCNCDGTMKYIHLQCLRLLIQSKIKKTENDSCKVLTFKRLECEICKTAFPEKISIKGSLFSIIDIDKPDKDYIILEGLIKEFPEEKSIFIVHFKNKKEIKIGRATDANIRLNDISVSRAHAKINLYNDNFYLHDTNSKFGTLIRMKNIFKIFWNKPFYVQKGNTFYEFIMKRTFWAYFKCYKQKNDFYSNYNEYFDNIHFSKYLYRKSEDVLINEKTKSVSEYSSEVVIKYNKMDTNSMKNFNIRENNSKRINQISIYNKSNKGSSPQAAFDSFRFNRNKIKENDNSRNNIIDKTNENSNIIQIYKNDLTKSKSKDGLNIDDQENNNISNSLVLNKIAK